MISLPDFLVRVVLVLQTSFNWPDPCHMHLAMQTIELFHHCMQQRSHIVLFTCCLFSWQCERFWWLATQHVTERSCYSIFAIFLILCIDLLLDKNILVLQVLSSIMRKSCEQCLVVPFFLSVLLHATLGHHCLLSPRKHTKRWNKLWIRLNSISNEDGL